MNSRPIEEARDSLIAVALPALLRARRRAEEIALRTGTALVFSKDGRTVLIYPKPDGQRNAKGAQ
jgi:hypothetical protein